MASKNSMVPSALFLNDSIPVISAGFVSPIIDMRKYKND